MGNVQTHDLINDNLSHENEAKLNQVLNGQHNEFDENSIGKVSSLRDMVAGDITAANYKGRFWQVQLGFGISLVNDNTHIKYYCSKDGVEAVTLTRLIDETWSKTFIKREDDNTCSASTETIDPVTFRNLVGDNTSNMDMIGYENEIEQANIEYPKTTTESKIQNQSMLEIFNGLIAEPSQYSNSSFGKN